MLNDIKMMIDSLLWGVPIIIGFPRLVLVLVAVFTLVILNILVYLHLLGAKSTPEVRRGRWKKTVHLVRFYGHLMCLAGVINVFYICGFWWSRSANSIPSGALLDVMLTISVQMLATNVALVLACVAWMSAEVIRLVLGDKT